MNGSSDIREAYSHNRSEDQELRQHYVHLVWQVAFLSFLLMAMALRPLHAQVAGSEAELAPNAAQNAIPESYFGMNLAGASWKHPWPTVNVGSVRTFDSEWTKVEPEKGVWDFTHLDQDVAAAQAHHAEAQLVLDTTPTWASARPNETYPYAWEPSGSRAEAENIADWETYVRTVAERYKGRVHVYEMWNEPNMKGSFTGGNAQLIQLCRSAYRVLKQVDPAILVVSPSPAPGGGSIWLHTFIDQGAGDTFDILGFHFYDNLGATQIHPESIIGTAEHLRQMLAIVRLPNKPIWNTESGYYIHSSPAARTQIGNLPPHIHVLSQQEAVDAVGRAYALGWASGIERFYWYGWGEPQYAIVDDLGATPKDATTAYATISKWLTGATYLSVTNTHAGEWIVALRAKNGAPQYIVWTTGNKESFTIPADWKVLQVDDLTGGHVPISTSAIDLGGTPRLLH